MQSSNSSKKTTKIAEESGAPVPEFSTAAEKTSKPRTSRSSMLKKETSETGTAKHRKISSPESPLESSPAGGGRGSEISPSHEEIANLAHSYWVARGYEYGSPEEDWLRAEQELKAGR